MYVNTVAGTATAHDDYTQSARRLDFAPRTQQHTVTVATIEDSTIESDETFILQLSAPHNAALDSAALSAAVTILDDDTGLSIADAPDVTEGDDLTFTVTLGQARTWPVTFDYTTRDGTATAPADYATTSARTARILAYTTTFTITVPTNTDTEIEGFEQLEVVLSNASGAPIQGPHRNRHHQRPLRTAHPHGPQRECRRRRHRGTRLHTRPTQPETPSLFS